MISVRIRKLLRVLTQIDLFQRWIEWQRKKIDWHFLVSIHSSSLISRKSRFIYGHRRMFLCRFSGFQSGWFWFDWTFVVNRLNIFSFHCSWVRKIHNGASSIAKLIVANSVSSKNRQEMKDCGMLSMMNCRWPFIESLDLEIQYRIQKSCLRFFFIFVVTECWHGCRRAGVSCLILDKVLVWLFLLLTNSSIESYFMLWN